MQHLKTCLATPFLFAAFILLNTGCSRQPPVYSEHFNAFGEIALVTVIGTNREDARHAVTEARNLLAMVEKAWNPAAEGDLNYSNHRFSEEVRFVAPPSITPLVEMSRQFHESSNGNFDPAMGKYLELWGVYGEEGDTEPAPADDNIADIMRSNPSISDIEMDGLTLQSGNSDVKLDFGVLKKAYAMELFKRTLINAGAHDALVRIGGDIVTIGSRGGEPWQISVPRGDGTGVLGTMKLRYNETGFTVSARHDTFIRNKEVYHRIIDPKTGKPVTHTKAVTVVHEDPTLAAAGSTAIFAAGPKAWRETAKAMGIQHLLLIDDENTIHVTPELKDRFKFDVPQKKLVIAEL